MESSLSYEIFLWKDVRKSSAVFTLSLFLLSAFSFYSILTVLTCIAIPFITIMLMLRAIWILKCAFMKESMENPFQSWLDADIELNEDKISKCNKSFLVFVNRWMILLRKVILVADLMNTAKALGLLFMLYYLGNAFSGVTLLFLADVIAFTVPKIFSLYKTEINNFKKTFDEKYNDFYQRIRSAIPIGDKQKQS